MKKLIVLLVCLSCFTGCSVSGGKSENVVISLGGAGGTATSLDGKGGKAYGPGAQDGEDGRVGGYVVVGGGGE